MFLFNLFNAVLFFSSVDIIDGGCVLKKDTSFKKKRVLQKF